MMLSHVRSKLAHDGVRNAVQLTVAELAAVESHPLFAPAMGLKKEQGERGRRRADLARFSPARHGEQMQVMRVIRGQ
jgi:hypothetical protein